MIINIKVVKEILLVGVGGFLGSSSRYLVAVLVSFLHPNHSLPISTFLVNIFGSLLIGIFITLMQQNSWYLLAVVGFCGGFTTFSAFSAELFQMIEKGDYLHSILYVVLSVVLCLIAVWVGVMLSEKFIK